MTNASPAARCLGCGFAWNSPAMAHGLRAIGACPKCGGELEFLVEATAPTQAGAEAADHGAPHLALGRPHR